MSIYPQLLRLGATSGISAATDCSGPTYCGGRKGPYGEVQLWVGGLSEGVSAPFTSVLVGKNILILIQMELAQAHLSFCCID